MFFGTIDFQRTPQSGSFESSGSVERAVMGTNAVRMASQEVKFPGAINSLLWHFIHVRACVVFHQKLTDPCLHDWWSPALMASRRVSATWIFRSPKSFLSYSYMCTHVCAVLYVFKSCLTCVLFNIIFPGTIR